MGAARPTLASDLGEQAGVGLGDGHVVGDHLHGSEHVVHKGSTAGARLPNPELHTHSQLGHGDRGDREVVIVVDDLIQESG